MTEIGQHPKGQRADHLGHACPDCPFGHPNPFCPTCLGAGLITTARLAQWQREHLAQDRA